MYSLVIRLGLSMANCAKLADFYLPTKGDLDSNLEKKRKIKKCRWNQRNCRDRRDVTLMRDHRSRAAITIISQIAIKVYLYLISSLRTTQHTNIDSQHIAKYIYKIKGESYSSLYKKKKKDERWIAMRNIWEQHSKNKNKRNNIRKTLFPSIYTDSSSSTDHK